MRLENWPDAVTMTLSVAFYIQAMAVRHKEESSSSTALIPTEPPPLYKVLLLNDDYTPMEFVVKVLEQFFLMNRERATQVMLKVHTEGSGVAGTYPKDLAETKVNQVMEFARSHQHPLQCVMEEDR